MDMRAELQGSQGNGMLNFIFWVYFAYENTLKIISHGTTQFLIITCSLKIWYLKKIFHVYNQVKAKGQASISTLRFFRKFKYY